VIEFLQNFHGEYGVFIKSLIAGTFVSAACGMIGCFIILRRLSFLSDALAHSMLTGVIVGYLLVKILTGSEPEVPAMIFGALFAGLVTVAMVSFVTKVSRVKQDTAIGIMYTGIFAIGGFVISLKAFGRFIHKDLYHLIIGDVLAVSNSELWMLAVILVVVFGFITLFFRQLQLTSFDPVMAAAIGVPVVVFDYGLTISTSLVVVGGVTIVGVILVVALMITPAATAYLLFDRLKPMLIASSLFGVVGYWLGYLLAFVFGVAPGSAVVVMLTFNFLVVLVLAPRYGLLADWLRKRQMVPQPAIEDVLGYVLKANPSGVEENRVIADVPGAKGIASRAIRSLIGRDLLERAKGKIALTNEGRKEAVRLRRAHRLWETYLQHAGMPESDLHDTAHLLEHVNDPAAIDYLDDKLGHPTHDPHGSEIPEDEFSLDQNQTVILSKLRDGYEAEVVSVADNLKGTQLEAGMHLRVGPRVRDGEVWTVEVSQIGQVQLNHEQADSVIVKVVSQPD